MFVLGKFSDELLKGRQFSQVRFDSQTINIRINEGEEKRREEKRGGEGREGEGRGGVPDEVLGDEVVGVFGVGRDVGV